MPDCSKGTLIRFKPSDPTKLQYIPARCKRFSCPTCGPPKKIKYRKAIYEARATHRLQRHVVLTLDPGLIPADTDSLVYIQRVWQRFRLWMLDNMKLKLTYIRTIELQENGTAHFHMLIGQTITQDTIIQAWRGLGGGHQCRIRFRDGNRGAAYITKYISKDLVTELRPHARRVATSQGIKLFQPTLPTGWWYSGSSFVSCIAHRLTLNYMEAQQCSISNYFEADTTLALPPPKQIDWKQYVEELTYVPPFMLTSPRQSAHSKR